MHIKEKDFWTWGIIFISTSNNLNAAHIRWLEYALVKKAIETKRCKLDNGNTPQEPSLNESDKATISVFLKEVLRMLPLVGLRAFEKEISITPQPYKQKKSIPPNPQSNIESNNSTTDTVVVPAKKENFEKLFLGENRWYAIRIGKDAIQYLKFIAAYQTAPVSAITYIAEIKNIESYGENGKYLVNFKEPAQKITPIPSTINGSQVQGPRFTTKEKLLQAKTTADLWGKNE